MQVGVTDMTNRITPEGTASETEHSHADHSDDSHSHDALSHTHGDHSHAHTLESPATGAVQKKAEHSHAPHRHLSSILKIIEAAPLSDAVKARSVREATERQRRGHEGP